MNGSDVPLAAPLGYLRLLERVFLALRSVGACPVT